LATDFVVFVVLAAGAATTGLAIKPSAATDAIRYFILVLLNVPSMTDGG